jgi:hypothetical protein
MPRETNSDSAGYTRWRSGVAPEAVCLIAASCPHDVPTWRAVQPLEAERQEARDEVRPGVVTVARRPERRATRADVPPRGPGGDVVGLEATKASDQTGSRSNLGPTGYEPDPCGTSSAVSVDRAAAVAGDRGPGCAALREARPQHPRRRVRRAGGRAVRRSSPGGAKANRGPR